MPPFEPDELTGTGMLPKTILSVCDTVIGETIDTDAEPTAVF